MAGFVGGVDGLGRLGIFWPRGIGLLGAVWRNIGDLALGHFCQGFIGKAGTNASDGTCCPFVGLGGDEVVALCGHVVGGAQAD